jgi:hypothetical protein
VTTELKGTVVAVNPNCNRLNFNFMLENGTEIFCLGTFKWSVETRLSVRDELVLTGYWAADTDGNRGHFVVSGLRFAS